MKEVTIIIPNYNGAAFLERAIKALKDQTVSDYDLIVVDNASTDSSRDFLKENNICFIPMETNTGFAKAVNVGIMAAETPYVILLNNDTEVFPDYIEKLLAAIKKSKMIFSVSPMMIMDSKRTHVDDAGDGMNLLGWAYQRGTDIETNRYEKCADVFSSCAGAAIYRREVFDEIGLFDENHFAYLEDIDVGWRARLAGYVNRYCPQARVYHVGSGTSGSKYNPFKVRLTSRNNILLHYKNQPLIQLMINFIPLTVGAIIKAAFFCRRGFLKEYNEGIIQGFRDVKKVKKANPAKQGVLTYAAIEWMMIAGTFTYIINYLTRKS